MSLASGKRWALRRLADRAGRFKMLAVDQRPPIQSVICQKRGLAEAPFADVANVKLALARELGGAATAILLDPTYAYPAAIEHIDPHRGLLLTLEDSTFEETPGGRRSRRIPAWSVAKIKRLGADGVKLLVWYRPDAEPAVRRHQQDLVEAVGAECAAQDIPFLLELLIYPLGGEKVGEPAYEAARTRRVLDSLADFLDRKYAVDIFKLESPIGGADIPDPDAPAAAEAAARAQAAFDRMGKMLDRPWVMLSQGASMTNFRHLLHYACKAGASGYLAGRAIWAQAFQRFPDLDAMAAVLRAEGVPYMNELNALTDALAKPWSASIPELGLAAVAPGFAERYDDSAADAHPGGVAEGPRRILFVDTGNYCRSPVAEGALRKLAEADHHAIHAASAGIIDKHVGEPADPRAVRAASARGIDLSAFRARQIEAADFERHDLILAMDHENLERLRAICPPQFAGRLAVFLDFAGVAKGATADVADPYYGGEDGFTVMMERIERGAAGLLEHLPRLRNLY